MFCIFGWIRMYNNNNCIVCIDMELSDLDVEKGTILEIACLVTDQDLNLVSDEFNVVIHHPDTILNNTSEWTSNYLSSLIEKCKFSKINLKDAEQMLLDFLKKHIPQGTCPVAGNTIDMDRLFLIKHMPLINDYLHYRVISISSIKELVRRWLSDVYNPQPTRKLEHGLI